jgi:hypothetical protein
MKNLLLWLGQHSRDKPQEVEMEKRNIGSPTVLLDGVMCDGTEHGGCDRSCFLFWREEWLKRVTPVGTLSGMQTGQRDLSL